MKTADVIRQYFLDNQFRLAKGTIKHDRSTFKNFFSFCAKEYEQIKTADVRNWLGKRKSKGIKAATIIRDLVALRAFYSYCLEEGLVEENPITNVEPPKRGESLPVYLEMSQLMLLREMARDCLLKRAIIETLYATGVRISELVRIKKQDINWQVRQIIIYQGKGAKDRVVLFTAECAERLKHYLASRQDEMPYLFINKWGRPMKPATVQNYLRLCSKKLGFKVTPHVLRHTFAAHLAQKGMPLHIIQELLGHDNIENTRIYTKLFEHARKEQYDKYK